MSLELRWVGEPDYERVAVARHRCYSGRSGDLDRYRRGMVEDRRHRPGDFLLATRGGVDVGTATALSLHLWARGGRVPCQGVAYVGTLKTARRLGGEGEQGVATRLMHETLRLARERGEVVSALMPFRASYYEHFGYGNAERRCEWTVPLAICPRGDFAGYRFADAVADREAILDARARECAAGQCDVETTPAALDHWAAAAWAEGQLFVDQPDGPGTPLRGWAFATEDRSGPAAMLRVDEWCADTVAGLQRLLHFLASLRDQYTSARLTLPGDLPLNRLLRESQIPHRQVDHPVSACRPFTRMQVRVLDHKRFCEAMTLPAGVSGRVTVGVRETEGEVSRFTIEMADGRVQVTPARAEPEAWCSDAVWASVVTGDLPATQAERLGLLRCDWREAVALLDAFAVGPTPFCQEYF